MNGERRELVDHVLHLQIALLGVDRAIGIDEIVTEGLQVIRPGQGNPRPILEILVGQIDRRLRDSYDHRIERLQGELTDVRERLDRLEAPIDHRTTERLLSYHKSGMNVPRLARLFDLHRWQVYKLLEEAAAKD
jgi:hypothetical protein